MSLGWNYNPATGFAMDNGATSDRYAFVPTDALGNPKTLPTSSAVLASFVDTADHVGINIYSSGDENSGWRVGFDGTNVFIQKRTNGTLAGASATAAHGLSAAVPFTIDIRPGAVNGTTIEVRINSVPAAVVTYDITAADSDAGFGCYGFDSDVNGARVASFEVAQLIPTYTARADIPWFVCGGELWCSLDGVGLTLVERRALNGVGLIDGDDLDQIVYLVDGANAKTFDPSAQTVAKWIPSAGILPGQTADGTTDSTICEQFNGRMMLNEEQNIFGSAINNALDWDVTIVSGGAAFDFATTHTGKIGQPVKAMLRLGKTTFLVGCSRSLWLMRGDPALGAVEIDPIIESVGVTGKDAMIRVSDSIALVHTTQGLFAITADGTATPLSRMVLTQIITVDTVGTEYAVSMARDVKGSGTMIFLSPMAGGQGTHIYYDERTGKFLPPQYMGRPTGGGSGYFPEQYPERVGPLAAMEFDGRVLMMGRDGYVYTFSDDAETDDGDPIDSFMAMLVLHEGDLVEGVRLSTIDTMLADWSGAVDLAVYSGQTSEEAYGGVKRSLRRKVVSSPTRRRHTIDVAAPFLVIELSGAGGVGSAWGIEAIQAATTRVSIARTPYRPKPVAPLPCGTIVPGPQTPVTGGGPGPGDPAGGGPTKCVACDDWMAANTTGVVGGQPAYLLAGPDTLVNVQAAAEAAIVALLMTTDICDITAEGIKFYLTNDTIVTVKVGAATVAVSGVILASNLPMLAVASPADSSNTTWRAYFRCIDQE